MAEYGRGRSGPASSNVYTVLMIIAFLVLVTAIGYVWYTSAELFGPGNPFEVSRHLTPSIVSLA